MSEHMKRIVEQMKSDNIDIAFFNDPQTVEYLVGFASEPHERILALILFQNASSFLFTPALDQEDANNSVDGMDVYGYLDTENPWQSIKDLIVNKGVPTTNWAIEKEQLTVAKREALQLQFPNSQFDQDYSSLLHTIRMQKTSAELEKMKKAGFWADEAIKIGARTLKVGITEAEVVAEIEYQLKKRGVNQMSFSTMVLFGENAASPHGVPGTNKLKKNQFVLFDLGVIYEGYASDITRTLFFGVQPTNEQIDVYQTVLNAHDTAIKHAKTNMMASELDTIARRIIIQKGYGPYFNHRLGHGIGQSVHEFPSIMEGNQLSLVDNMCFSIEPGIYIPGKIGVRIEDCGYLDDDGFHSFTFFPTAIDAYQNFLNESK